MSRPASGDAAAQGPTADRPPAVPTAPRIVPPFAPDAVVFDLDGVLVDSEDLWGEAERRVVLDLGFAWDPAVRPLLRGQGAAEAAGALADFLGDPVTPAEIQQRIAAHIETAFADGVPVNEGARELVGALHGRVRLAVATNSNARLARQALATGGLDTWFDTVVTADEVRSPKPAPDVYLLACERIGARPARSVAIEDSAPGMASAAAAGLWVIARTDDDGSGAAVGAHVASLTDLDPEDLIGGRTR